MMICEEVNGDLRALIENGGVNGHRFQSRPTGEFSRLFKVFVGHDRSIKRDTKMRFPVYGRMLSIVT